MAQRLFTRNFLLLVAGQAASLFGNFILRLALSMYVLEATGSVAIFAGILSAAMLPTILLSPLGGVLADRMDKRDLMVALDTLAGISVLGAAFLLKEDNALALISALLVVLSILGAFETPVVQACIPVMLAGDNITKGNAVVNQVASISYLAAPMLGGFLYSLFALKPVMCASVACFFITALLECFIRLQAPRQEESQGEPLNVWQDLASGIRYLCKEQAGIAKMLWITALSRFFVMGVTIIGLPYIVRSVLGLGAQYYGAAESALAVAAIVGSTAAGLLTKRLRVRRLSGLLASLGAYIGAAGIALALPVDAGIRYAASVLALCGLQATVSIFSIFAVSLIQRQTPSRLIGKVMAYTAMLTLCAQPVGQLVYGFLFDRFCREIAAVLLFSGAAVCALGLWTAGFFQSMEREEQQAGG